MRIDTLDHASRADRMHARWMGVLAVLTLLVPVLLVGELLVDGLPALSTDFLLSAPADAGRGGGIGSVLVSTLWVLGVCLAVVLPLGLGCALFLVEHVRAGSRLERGLQLTLDVLGGVPSIVFGLFGLAVLIGIVWLFSNNRRAVDWKLVATGLVLQIAFAAVVLLVPGGREVFDWLSHGFVRILGFVAEGSNFIFGSLWTWRRTASSSPSRCCRRSCSSRRSWACSTTWA